MDPDTFDLLKSKVKRAENGLRLDIYLAQRYRYLSRTQWQKKIKSGQVQINGSIAKSSETVTSGFTIGYMQSHYVEPQIDPWFAPVFEDAHLLVVNKSGNLPVHAAGHYRKNTLIHILRSRYKDKNLDLANRLDRETSGLVVLGKNPDIMAKLSSIFKKRRIKKTYLLIVFGNIKDNEFTVDRPTGPNPLSIIRIKHWVDTPESRSAITEFKKIRDLHGYSLLRAVPATGRTNQIRIHISYAGYPIVGDKLYSGNDMDFLEFVENSLTPGLEKRLKMKRQALHAAALDFVHPATGKELHMEAPMPEDMKEFIEEHGNCK